LVRISSRRNFLRVSAAAGSGVLFLTNSRLAFAAEANQKLNVAFVGVGGQGRSNLDNIARQGENIAALCDVDQVRAADTFKKYPDAGRFTDFRRMLDQAKSIDAVVVSTPDHTHAVAVLAALRRGKPVFCEKPLTRTVYEARVLRAAALKHNVPTQLGNQGSSENRLRRAVELTRGGVIGQVTQAHVWFDGGNGPQKRPTDTPPVPATLDWDLWVGPAPYRPYHSAYLPASWRSWRAFGSGIVGDFGCHTGNIMFHALELARLWNDAASQGGEKRVLRVEGHASEIDPEGYPRSSRVIVQCPARGKLPPVTLTIYAKEKPAEDLMLGYPQGRWGDLLVGDKGSLYSDCPWNTRYFLLPEKQFDGFTGGPPETLPRARGGHHREWLDACKGQGKTFAGFEVGGPLSELMQLANVAAQVEGPFSYDVLNGRVLDHSKADELLRRPYRDGWNLEAV
jgi:predicted dehydrogenase